MRERRGRHRAEGRRFALIVARTNELVTQQLLDGALECLRRHGGSDDAIDVFSVPGSWELAPFAWRLAGTKRYAAMVALGAIIRGETPHFDYLSRATTHALADVATRSGVYVALGVVTTDDLEQALERAGAQGTPNYGWNAALAAIEMADLFSQLDEDSD